MTTQEIEREICKMRIEMARMTAYSDAWYLQMARMSILILVWRSKNTLHSVQ